MGTYAPPPKKVPSRRRRRTRVSCYNYSGPHVRPLRRTTGPGYTERASAAAPIGIMTPQTAIDMTVTQVLASSHPSRIIMFVQSQGNGSTDLFFGHRPATFLTLVSREGMGYNDFAAWRIP